MNEYKLGLCCLSPLILFFTSLVLVCQSNFCIAQPVQRIEIPFSFNPVGSGARALGMGGAFIAVADDATAASWNPGGLIQLETPEVSIVGAYFYRTEDLTFGEAPEASGSENVSDGNLNYFSAAYPFSAFNRNMIVSLNYQYLYDFTRDWQFSVSTSESNLTKTDQVDYQQNGGLSAIGLAYSIQIIPQLSLGFSFNYWGDSLIKNGWEQKTKLKRSGTYVGNPFTYSTDLREQYDFIGFNANIGFLWNITNRVTLGGVFKTPFTADLTNESTYSYALSYHNEPDLEFSDTITSKSDQELAMPMSYGIGLAYRFSDSWSTSIDIYRTEWGDFILTDENGNKTSPITGKPESESSVDPTHQVRLGSEYLYIGNKYVIPVRGGVLYDPAPAEGSPDAFYGVALGSGIIKGKFLFDLAYQYRFGNDVGSYIMESLDFSMNVKEHTVYGSLIYHF